MSSGKVLLGVLAGVAAGALMGILFAPAKGTVTRKRLSKKGDDYVEDMKEKFNDFMEEIKEDFDEVKEKVTDFSKDGHAKAEGAKAK